MLFAEEKCLQEHVGEFLIGFCFLFMGLDLISQYVPNLQENPEMLKFMSGIHVARFRVCADFLLHRVGAYDGGSKLSGHVCHNAYHVCSQSWISFELGCAIILGGNIGTTITPVLASLSGNLAAKRA